MTTEQIADAALEATDAPPQEGDPAALAAGEAGDQSGSDTAPPPAATLDDLKKLRSENRSLRERLKALEEAKKAEDEAKLSEGERSAKRISDLERELAERESILAERTVLAATVDAASRLGFANPRLAYRLIDRSEVEYEDGVPVNIESMLRRILKDEPYLASAHARPTGSIDGGTRGAAGLTLEQINAMTPEQYEARRDEIMAWLAKQR